MLISHRLPSVFVSREGNLVPVIPVRLGIGIAHIRRVVVLSCRPGRGPELERPSTSHTLD